MKMAIQDFVGFGCSGTSKALDQLSNTHATVLQHGVGQIELKRPCWIQRGDIQSNLALVELLDGRCLHDLFDLCFEVLAILDLHELIEVL